MISKEGVMSRKRLFVYAIGIIIIIGLLSICLVARGRPSVTPAAALEKGKQTIVASATIASANEQPGATSTPLPGTSRQSTSTPLPGTSGQSTATTSPAGSGTQCGNVNLAPSGKLVDSAA